MIDLSSMTYMELFKLNRMVEREMSFRAEPWIIVVAIISILSVIIYMQSRKNR